MSRQPPVLILGAHRSGTSCLATCLTQCGLSFYDLNRDEEQRRDPRSGFTIVRRMHEQIVASNRTAWYSPPEEFVVAPGQQRQLMSISDELRSGRDRRGLKDPGILLLLDHWQRALGKVQLIGTFRHPLAFVHALRDQSVTTDELLQLWLHYNRRLVRAFRRFRFPLIEYDLADTTSYIAKVYRISRRLKTRTDRTQLLEFGRNSLIRQSVNPTLVPPQCRNIYRYLRKRAITSAFTTRIPKGSPVTEKYSSFSFVESAHMPPNTDFAYEDAC